MWLTGRWECSDRLLRSPTNELPYAFLESLRIAEGSIVPSEALEGGSFHISCWCSFLPDQFGHPLQARWVPSELGRKAFCFAMPYPDHFTLRRDPSRSPQWFILEHQIAGDMLFFRRSSVGSSPENKD
jgi:hypothetical protein